MPSRFHHAHRAHRAAFTILELLVVISIVSLLVALLLPALAAAKESANATYCQSNLRSLGLTMNYYTDDFSSRIPYASPPNGYAGSPTVPFWFDSLAAYLPNKISAVKINPPTGVWMCPSIGSVRINVGQRAHYAANGVIVFRSNNTTPWTNQYLLDQVNRPSFKIAIAEFNMANQDVAVFSGNTSGVAVYNLYPTTTDEDLWFQNPNAGPTELRYRHSRNCNAVMFDLHVEPLRFGTVTNGRLSPTFTR